MKRFVGSFVSVALCCVMLMSLAACGGSPTAGGGIDADAKKAVENAAKKLNDTYTNYIISNTMEFYGTGSEFIEVVKDNDIYTEVSLGDEGDVGQIPYGSADSVSYALIDWTHEGQFYSFTYEEDGATIYKFPENFGTKYNHDREMLWANRALAGATEIVKVDDMQLTLNGTTETYSAYRLKVKADTVMQLLSSNSWGVYSSVKEAEKSSSNVSKLCDFYMKSTEMERTYSDAYITYAIDADGILKFMSLEVGGLGEMMYYTKAVVDVRNQNVRETPDFSTTVPLVSTMTELADFVAQYPDYDSAVKALNDKFSELDTDMDGLDLDTSGADGGEADSSEGAGADGDVDQSVGESQPDASEPVQSEPTDGEVG